MEQTLQQQALNAFTSELAKAEGKNHQASIGDVRELISLANEKLEGSLYLMIYAWWKAQQKSG